MRSGLAQRSCLVVIFAWNHIKLKHFVNQRQCTSSCRRRMPFIKWPKRSSQTPLLTATRVVRYRSEALGSFVLDWVIWLRKGKGHIWGVLLSRTGQFWKGTNTPGSSDFGLGRFHWQNQQIHTRSCSFEQRTLFRPYFLDVVGFWLA